MGTLTHRPTEAGLRRAGTVPGLASVIVPAYNAERWIGDTLASVRAQSYRPIEIIVVDDGSADATASVAGGTEGVVLRQTTGAGPGGARNAGLALARGEFIQYLDADDMLARDKITRQVRTLVDSGAEVAWESFHHLVPANGASARFEVGRVITPTLGADLSASLLTARGFVQIGAMLVRRSARTDRVWFAEGRDVVEDVRYVVSLAMEGARFVCSESGEPGLLFRQHDGPRHSTRPLASFARSCAANATWAQAEWDRNGGLTAGRRAALCEAYAFAARQLAAVDPAAFADIAARGAAMGPEFIRALPARLRWLSRLVGYPRAESIAMGWRRIRASRFAGGAALGADRS